MRAEEFLCPENKELFSVSTFKMMKDAHATILSASHMIELAKIKEPEKQKKRGEIAGDISILTWVLNLSRPTFAFLQFSRESFFWVFDK